MKTSWWCAMKRSLFRCASIRAGLLLHGVEREIFIDNLLVLVHLVIEMSRPALRHVSLNSLFQVALYLLSLMV